MMSLFLYRFPFTLLFLFHFRCRFRFRFRFLFPLPFLFRIPDSGFRLFQTPLLEWGCNGLKHATNGLRDVKEGGISARKAGLL